MKNLNIYDLFNIKNENISSTTIKRQLNDMLESSKKYFAIVESLNRETGEYKIVVQGTLDNTQTW
ncbi:hypothetical protein JXJ21_22900 [candidate division KSB1 bacterium]|nr:hypothetical protein [candidate division KSB1 bacterium]